MLSDCKEAIETIKGKEIILNHGGYALDGIRKEMNNDQEWRFEFVSRKHNEIAHTLAKLSLSPANFLDWVSSKVESWIQGLRSRD